LETRRAASHDGLLPVVSLARSADAQPSRDAHRLCVHRQVADIHPRWDAMALLVFLHGSMGPRAAHNGWHRMWWRLASTAASCGFVVVVPRHGAPEQPNASAVAKVMTDLDWVRKHWIHAEWVAQEPSFAAVGGHSFGALTAAVVAADHPELGAYISLGGYHFRMGRPETLVRVGIPSFFMWCPCPEENLKYGLWSPLTMPKHAAVYQGTHFDYLDPGDLTTFAQHGDCPLMADVAAELVTLFLTRSINMQNALLTQIPPDLQRPQAVLTQQQANYAADRFSSLDRINTETGCRVDLEWDLDGVTGSRHFGPA
jgi:pimeloyl-ACP methyl ester carboxylesterase